MSLIDAEILEGILSRAAHLVTPEESFRLAGLPPGLTVVASPRDGAPSRVVWTILTAENGGASRPSSAMPCVRQRLA